MPPALGAVHNFIYTHDKDEIHDFENVVENLIHDVFHEELARGPAGAAERQRADAKQDQIAQAMW